MPKANEAPQIDQLFTEVKDLSDQLLQLPGQKYQREKDLFLISMALQQLGLQLNTKIF